MRLFTRGRGDPGERLLWTRDLRFLHQVRDAAPGGRSLELDTGGLYIADESVLDDAHVAAIARRAHNPEYGLVPVDTSLPTGDRYVVALSAAVQLSGIADRIGMGHTVQTTQLKALDYFFACRNLHGVEFQPIIALATGEVREHECLFRPYMPNLKRTIAAIVQAAIDTDRSVELDQFIFRTILGRAASLQDERGPFAGEPLNLAINLTPASIVDERFTADRIVEAITSVGLDPERITIECTEQQAVPSVDVMARCVREIRAAGMGFAVDDAGAGYASLSLVVALRPSVIKIDRDIVRNVASDAAKQALVDALVGFAGRIGARLTAEGIEEVADLEALLELGVDQGQGYLLGRPGPEPVMMSALQLGRESAAETTTESTDDEPGTIRHLLRPSRVGRILARTSSLSLDLPVPTGRATATPA